MEAKLLSAALSLPSVSSRALAFLLKGFLVSMIRSAPVRIFAWLSISRCKLSLNEYTATSAAIPRMTDEMKSNKRDLLRRLSLHAILNSQPTLMALLNNVMSSGIRSFIRKYHPAFYFYDPAGA